METPGGREVAAAFLAGSGGFDASYEAVLGALVEPRSHTKALRPNNFGSGGAESMFDDDLDLSVLRSRVSQVKRQDRARTASEVLHAKVLQGFRDLSLPLMPPLMDAGITSDYGHVEPRRFVRDIYSQDALEMVRDHVMSIIREVDHLSRDFPLQLSRFQAGQVYAASVAFGYALRRLDVRYQLERHMGAVQSLAEYIATLGNDELHRVANIVSWEAEEVLERHMAAVFGDMPSLQAEMLRALQLVEGADGGAVGEDAAATTVHLGDTGRWRLQELIERREVASVRLSVNDLRRLALEGSAFGYLLNEAESDLDASIGLTSASGHGPTTMVTGHVDRGLSFTAFNIFGA